MALDSKVRAHFATLFAEAKSLSRASNEHGQLTDPNQMSECIAWLAQASQLVASLVADPQNVYRQEIEKRARMPADFKVHVRVREAASMLARLGDDVQQGFLGPVADRASAATFEDLLDHGEAYLGDGRKEPAGVLAGVVFEDSARRVFRKVLNQADKDKNLEQIINALMASPLGSPTINGVEGKRAKAAAGVRTSATHAQWNEFSVDDVRATITFTREFIEKHLA